MTQQRNDPYGTSEHQHAETKHCGNTQPCPCGCAPCDETCCELECAERPRFYCGQLLGEDDLTTLVDWTRVRLRRNRYHHGWGIVCGLNVHCDPKNPTGVILGEGYAVDCCGEDIVVCKDTPVDLSDACQEEACLDPWHQSDDRENPERDERDQPCPDIFDVLKGAAAFDLYLHYHEQGSQPESSLGSCSCGNGSSCEFSRTQETYRISWEPVPPDRKDPKAGAFEEWQAGYKRHMERLMQFFNEIIQAFTADRDRRHEAERGGRSPDAEDWAATVRRKLRRWIKQNPLHHFCFIDAWLADPQEYDLLEDGCLTRLLFWLMMEYRLAWLHCDCPRCDPQTGVPLARVWLQAPDYRRDRQCLVLLVHDWQPFRRLIRPDECLPSLSNCINTGQFLWQRKEDVERQYGDSFRPVSIPVPSDLERLKAWIQSEMDAELCHRPSPNDPLRLAVTNLPEFQGERVIGLKYSSAEPY
jgi:hypothetical protein